MCKDVVNIPVCPLHLTGMHLQELVHEDWDQMLLVLAYVCSFPDCKHCYNETFGYFDFIAGRPYLASEQILCERDAHAMFLEHVNLCAGGGTWRCPSCDAARNGL